MLKRSSAVTAVIIAVIVFVAQAASACEAKPVSSVVCGTGKDAGQALASFGLDNLPNKQNLPATITGDTLKLVTAPVQVPVDSPPVTFNTSFPGGDLGEKTDTFHLEWRDDHGRLVTTQDLDVTVQLPGNCAVPVVFPSITVGANGAGCNESSVPVEATVVKEGNTASTVMVKTDKGFSKSEQLETGTKIINVPIKPGEAFNIKVFINGKLDFQTDVSRPAACPTTSTTPTTPTTPQTTPPAKPNNPTMQGAPPANQLPFTGGNAVVLALIGAGAIIGGTELVRKNRAIRIEEQTV